MSVAAFTRMLRRRGETWTLNTWSGSATDSYEDELPTGPLSSTFKALRAQASDGEDERTEKGRTRFMRLDLLVLSTLAFPATTDNEQPVTVTDPDGRNWNVIEVDKTGAPVGAKRLKLMTGGRDAALYL